MHGKGKVGKREEEKGTGGHGRVRLVVVMVTLELALFEPSSVTEDGETVQVAAGGAPVQVHLTVPLNPPPGESEAVKIADSPAVIVLLAGLTAAAKSGEVLVGWTDWRAWTTSSRPLPISAPTGCA